MTKQIVLTLLTPALGFMGLAGCGHHHDEHIVRETTVVREPAPASERIIIEGDGPEPPLRAEKVIVRPRPDAVWERGHWVREGHSWVWVPGYWR